MDKLKAFVVILIILGIVGGTVWYVYDQVNKFNKDYDNRMADRYDIPNGQDKTDDKKDEEGIKVEEKDNILYVNGNKVDFYSKSNIRDKYDNENAFYCSNGVEKRIDVKNYETYNMKDVVLVKLTPCNYDYQYVENYFVDSNGKVLRSVNGENADIELSINDALFDVKKIEDNQIYLSTTVDRAKYYNSRVCDKIKEDKGNEIVEYTDKITYENGEFRLDKAVETTTYIKYYENGKNGVPCIVESNNIEDVENYKRVYIDVLNQLKINKTSETVNLTTLDKSTKYSFIESRYIDSNDTKCNASKDGLYIFLTDNKANPSTYVIFYDINTGEKSELLNVTDGSADSLITCK